MGALYDFEPEKLILGVIYSDRAVFDEAMELIKAEFGEFDGECEEFSFSDEFSTYYDEELGGKGIRKIFSFERLVDPSRHKESISLLSSKSYASYLYNVASFLFWVCIFFTRQFKIACFPKFIELIFEICTTVCGTLQ